MKHHGFAPSPSMIDRYLSHRINDFLENEHFIILAPVSVFFLGYGWPIIIFIPELHNLESSAVDIEMDIPFLIVGSDELTHVDAGIQLLNGLPCSLADATAVCSW